MELNDDILLGKIIPRLPLKFVVQCKLLSKDIKIMISHPDFARTLYQHHKETSTQLIYSINGLCNRTLHKFSLNPTIPNTQSVFPYRIEIMASCNGLILFDFHRAMCYCVFNPVTGEHQLIPYPDLDSPCLHVSKGFAVDYPTSDQYKVVIISRLVQNSNLYYKFHILSSERPGLWHEIQLRTNTFIRLAYGSPSVYWLDSLYWLREDGSILAFDTKREEARLIDRPQFIDHFYQSYGKMLIGEDKWLGMARGFLTLVCIFRKYIVIATYGSESSRWWISHTLDSFVSCPDGIIIGFPVWIDSRQVSFMVKNLINYDLYEYNTQIGRYENNAEVLESVSYPMYGFHPTLASVHIRTPPNSVTTYYQAYIAAELDDIRRFIIEGISVPEETSSGESSEEENEEEAGGKAGGGGGAEEIL